MSKMIICLIAVMSFAVGIHSAPSVKTPTVDYIDCEATGKSEGTTDEVAIQYESLDVPDIPSSFKAFMDYRTITDENSRQYQYISQHAQVDEHGFLRAESETVVPEDYYLIALGSFYGTDIGAKYKITTDSGGVFYGVLADCKADKHTNSTNQYTVVGTPNIVEFIVDTKMLNKAVKYHGSAGAHAPLSGNIVKIERIEEKFDG